MSQREDCRLSGCQYPEKWTPSKFFPDRTVYGSIYLNLALWKALELDRPRDSKGGGKKGKENISTTVSDF